MAKKSFFEGWGYSDSTRLLIKGETKNRNEFVSEFKKTYPKSQIEKSGQKGVELYVNENELPYVKKLVKIFNLKVAYNDGGKTESQEIARTILSQLGGQGRLIAMTGAYNFVALKEGVSFKIKNRKVNYIKITLNGNDLYDVIFGKIISYNLKVTSEHNDIYNDQLIPLFEKQTGMYLRLFKTGGVVFSNYNGMEIMYEPNYDEYFVNDEVFYSMEDAKNYIDSGESKNDSFSFGGGVEEKGNVPKKLIYVLYNVKDQADSILNANGTRNRGWWRSDLSRNESDDLIKKLKERKLIREAIIYIGDSTNIKFDLGGAIDEDEEDLFANYDKLPIRVQKVIADFSEDDNSYEDCERFIAKLNKVGYTCEYGLDAQPYGLRKLALNEKFVNGGKMSSSLKKGDKVEGYFHYDHTYGQYNIIPYNAYADNSEGVVVDVFKGGNGWRYEIEFKNGETLRLGESMLGEYYDKLRFAEGGMPQGMSIADANPYIAGAKAVQSIAPHSVSALDQRIASKLNPDPNRPVFFKTGGGVGDPYDSMTKYQLDKEYKKLNNKRDILKTKYGQFNSDETAENEKEIEKIITLLYGENFSGVGQKYKYAKGGMVVTSITEIPKFKQRLDEGKITYRGLGMGKLSDDFFDIAGESGTRIKVDGKEYFITHTEFDAFSRGADGKLRIRFDAPFRKN